MSKIKYISKNKWQLECTINGKRKRPIIIGSKKEAEARLAELISNPIEKALYKSRAKKITFEHFINNHYKIYCKNRKSEKTFKMEMEKMRQHFLPEFGNRILTDISKNSLNEYIDKRALKVMPETVNKDVVILKSIFNLAKDKGYISINYMKEISTFKPAKKEPEFLSVDEMKKVLKEAEASSHIFLAILIALNTGARKGEILTLKWNQIHFDIDMIKFHGKGAKDRWVPLRENVKKALLELDHLSDYVIHWKNKPITNLDNAWRRVKKRAGITRKFTFHNLRDTFASHATMQNVDSKSLSIILGHNSIKTTEKYGHVSNQHIKHLMKELKIP